MKRRVFFSLLIIAMAMAAITGGTLAWFTAQETVQSTFQAGTVAFGDITVDYENDITNWNPGDSEDITYTIENDGSKAIRLRVSFDGDWGDGDLNENDPVAIVLDDAAWVDGEDGYFYFDGEIASESIVTLNVNVTFVGALAGNDYQGQTYELTTLFQAVQASYFEDTDGWEWDDIDWSEFE